MTPQELEQRRQEARAAGYSDQEIDDYLNRIRDPSQSSGVDQTPEVLAIAAKGLGTAGLGYGVYRGARSIAQQMKSGPVAPPAMAPMPTPTPQQQTFDALRSTDLQNQQRQPAAQSGKITDYARRMQQIAAQQAERIAAMARQPAPAAPMLRGLGALGAALYSPGLNAGEDEYLRQLRERAARGELPR